MTIPEILGNTMRSYEYLGKYIEIYEHLSESTEVHKNICPGGGRPDFAVGLFRRRGCIPSAKMASRASSEGSTLAAKIESPGDFFLGGTPPKKRNSKTWADGIAGNSRLYIILYITTVRLTAGIPPNAIPSPVPYHALRQEWESPHMHILPPKHAQSAPVYMPIRRI